MPTIAIKDCGPYLRARRPWTTRYQMWSRTGRYNPDASMHADLLDVAWCGPLGAIPARYVDRAILAADERLPGGLYVVWSYSTPIGWHTFHDGWFIPPISYTQTTRRHQRVLLTATGAEWATLD